MHIEVQQLGEVAELMERHGLTRVRLTDANGPVVELERAGKAPAAGGAAENPSAPAAPASATGAGAVTTAGASAQTAPAPATPAPADAPAADLVPVTAPMMGMFYIAPQPGAEPFVRAGSHVEAGDTLCVIEAMKLMNEVAAPCTGEVVEVLVGDDTLVEFGQTLALIREEAAHA